MLKSTLTERILIRNHILGSDNTVSVQIWDNEDGTVAMDVDGIIFESHSYPELFKELSEILEEA